MIDESIDRIINVHDDLLAEINEISIMENEKVKSRITDKLDDWFYKDFLFVSSVTGMITSISDRPQIESIITEYKSTQRKIYMI